MKLNKNLYVTIFFSLVIFSKSTFALVEFGMQKGDYVPEFRLLGSDGKSYTLSNFNESKNIVLLFLTGHYQDNLTSIENFKSLSGKVATEKASFIIVSQHSCSIFFDSDTSLPRNLVHLIDYNDNSFTKQFINGDKPVVAIINKERQLVHQEELFAGTKFFEDLFQNIIPSLLEKVDSKIESKNEKSFQVVDKTISNKNYGLAVNVVNLTDLEFIKSHVANEERVVFYFWSTKWDQTTFELSDLNFTTQALKSVGVKLIPINIDGKHNFKKVWLTLYKNECYGDHFVSEINFQDKRFSSFQNIIEANKTTNYVILSKTGEVLYAENDIVSLIEMRKKIIATLKKKEIELIKPLVTYSN